MTIRNVAAGFLRRDDGAVTVDWLLQLALVVVVAIGVLSTVTSGDAVSANGHTHHNGVTVTSQYP